MTGWLLTSRILLFCIFQNLLCFFLLVFFISLLFLCLFLVSVLRFFGFVFVLLFLFRSVSLLLRFSLIFFSFLSFCHFVCLLPVSDNLSSI